MAIANVQCQCTKREAFYVKRWKIRVGMMDAHSASHFLLQKAAACVSSDQAAIDVLTITMIFPEFLPGVLFASPYRNHT